MKNAERASSVALWIFMLSAAIFAQTLTPGVVPPTTSLTTSAGGAAISQNRPNALKVYISVDMEGISGLNSDDQLAHGQPEYGRARKLMAEDANAAIRGAFAAGATEVLVNDSHGWMRNLLPEDLDNRASLISHNFKQYGMMEGLDETFHAVIFVGYHAKADSPRGLFAHTGSGVVRDLQINGRSVGEGGMNAALAAWYGVPVVAVSGDDAAVAEVKDLVPGIQTAIVKRAINIRAVELKPLMQARREIEEAAATGVRSAKKTPPLRQSPYRVQLRYRNFTYPMAATAFREIELLAPDTVAFTRDTMPEAYRLIRVLYRYINPD